ncbi:hypothetical protein SAMN06265795_103338 [Noviherbaspirillum humi]|uniref:histidine kinase n=2 Tax=Noviherbaspirillum humi TaxID=1688639 RepID=A0A239FI15_9BURK|nr:hypothetical protein SAMN06265795_103338 [Noviherbaspirillum humi]
MQQVQRHRSRGRHRSLPVPLAGLAPDDHVCIALRDSGSRVSANTPARAVDPFFITQELADGAGMGLPQVRNFARLAGGALELFSLPGEGTQVTLYLQRKSHRFAGRVLSRFNKRPFLRLGHPAQRRRACNCA